MIAGIDEAGRGALAGPIVVALVILDPLLSTSIFKDSKTLTKLQRQNAYALLKNSTSTIHIAIINHKEIDRINVLNATLKGMSQCINKLTFSPERIIIDGNKAPLMPEHPIETCIKGDQKIKEISAASILAKEIRDKLMDKYHHYFPGYNFSTHKGYGTKIHYNAIHQQGPSPIHRQSFNLNKQLCLF